MWRVTVTPSEPNKLCLLLETYCNALSSETMIRVTDNEACVLPQ